MDLTHVYYLHEIGGKKNQENYQLNNGKPCRIRIYRERRHRRNRQRAGRFRSAQRQKLDQADDDQPQNRQLQQVGIKPQFLIKPGIDKSPGRFCYTKLTIPTWRYNLQSWPNMFLRLD